MVKKYVSDVLLCKISLNWRLQISYEFDIPLCKISSNWGLQIGRCSFLKVIDALRRDRRLKKKKLLDCKIAVNGVTMDGFVLSQKKKKNYYYRVSCETVKGGAVNKERSSGDRLLHANCARDAQIVYR